MSEGEEFKSKENRKNRSHAKIPEVYLPAEVVMDVVVDDNKSEASRLIVRETYYVDITCL